MNNLSGYNAFKANAGNIENKGFEIVLNTSILRDTEFKWDLRANISQNINKIIELHDEVDRLTLGGYDDVKIFAEKDKYYGAIYGTKYLRVEDTNSEHFGKLILASQTGLPQRASGGPYHLGDQTARALVGITNSFAYKNFGLSVQVDGRFGGKFFAGTHRAIQLNGSSAETVVNGERNNFVVEGVILNNNFYEANTIEVSPENYWSAVAGTGNLGITEHNILDATNIRIRNLMLNYNIPTNLLKSKVVKTAKFGFSMNNVLMLKSHGKGVDPESTFALSTNAVGFEYLSFPTSRSYYFNISVGF